MSDLKFKSYEGSIEHDVDRDLLWGKILHIDDLVTYEATTIGGLKREFEDAVEDYLETCLEIGKEPQKPYRGIFQVRIPPAMHKEAIIRARRDRTKLNDVVVQALADYLLKPSSKTANKPMRSGS